MSDIKSETKAQVDLFNNWKKWKVDMESNHKELLKYQPNFNLEQREGYYRYVFEGMKARGQTGITGFPGWPPSAEGIDFTKFTICPKCKMPALRDKCNYYWCEVARKNDITTTVIMYK